MKNFGNLVKVDKKTNRRKLEINILYEPEIKIMIFTQKYAPKKLEEIVGNNEKIEYIRSWVLQWINGKPKKPLLIYGSTGVGKTSVALAIAKEYDFDLIELNASDLRSRERVEKITGGAMLATSLFGKGRIVLIDDVEIMAGRKDSGGSSAISELLKNCPCPIIVTASDIWDKKLATIKNDCEAVEFKKINKIAIRKVLDTISKDEKINTSAETINQIAENCQGDLRAAINDLQTNKATNREREADVFETIRKVFKAEKYQQIKEITKGEFDYELIKLWVDENICAEFETKEEIAEAYDYLSKGDMFDYRIKKNHWQLLKYSIDLSIAGVSLSKKSVYRKFTKYSFPSYLKSMSKTVATRAIRKSAGQKIGKVLHVNWRSAIEQIMLLQEIGHMDPNGFMEIYKLEEEEAAFILGISASKLKQKS